MSENYYDILNVKETATKEEIKRAYRSLQMKFHPDKNPNNQEAINMTQKINEAYETLGDEQKRAEYDMRNKNPFMRMATGGVEVPMDDIFNMFFGGLGGPIPGMPPGARVHIFNGGPLNFQQAMSKPMPIMKTLQITMENVLTGASLPLEIERWVIENGTKVFEKETIYVEVPAGIDENEMIVLRDRGNIISEHQKGDIKISIQVVNNTPFRRSGLDLILDKNITLKEALCGFSFEIKYLNGKSYTLNNNKGSIVPPEYKKMYQGMGLKRGEHKGNMIIHFHIEFPDKLTNEQIDELARVL